MSVAEMKIAVISKITNLESEVVLNEVMKVLEANESEDKTSRISKNYESIKEQYGEVLQKLAE